MLVGSPRSQAPEPRSRLATADLDEMPAPHPLEQPAKGAVDFGWELLKFLSSTDLSIFTLAPSTHTHNAFNTRLYFVTTERSNEIKVAVLKLVRHHLQPPSTI